MSVEAAGEPSEPLEDGSIRRGIRSWQAAAAKTRCNEPPQEDIAGADAHFEQVAENGEVAELSGPVVGSILGSMEASATLNIGNPVHAVTSSMSLQYVRSAHAPTVGMVPSDRSWLPDRQNFVFPRNQMLRIGYLPMAGRMLPTPVTATIHTTTTTTITLTASTYAVQAGLVYTSYTGPYARTSGTYAIHPGHPMYRAADYQYQMGLMLIDPRDVRVGGYPDAGYAEIGAVGGVPIGAVGYLESDGCREQGSQGERTGTVPRCEQVTIGGYGAQPKEARTSGYYGYTGIPSDVMHADQAMVSGRVGWTGQAGTAGYRKFSRHLEQTVRETSFWHVSGSCLGHVLV